MDALTFAKTKLEYRQDAETDCRYGSSFAHSRRVVIDAVAAMGVVYALAEMAERYQGNTAGGIAHTLELHEIGNDMHKLIESSCVTDQYDRRKDNTALFAMREIRVQADWHVRDSFIADSKHRFRRENAKLNVYPHWVKKGEGGCFLCLTQDDVGLKGYMSPSGGGYNIVSCNVLHSEKLSLLGEEFTEENLMRIIDERGLRNPPPVL